MRALLALLLLPFVVGVATAQSDAVLARLRAHRWILHAVETPGHGRIMPVPGREPSIRFLTTRPRFDSSGTLFNASASGGCNGLGTVYRLTGDHDMIVSPFSSTMLYCIDGIYEFEQLFQYWLGWGEHFDVTSDRLVLWNRDSTTVMHFGIAPAEYGARIQVANLIPGMPGPDLFANGGLVEHFGADSFPRISTPYWFDRTTRRFSLGPRGAGFEDRFFDTTLPDEPGVSYLFVAHVGPGGEPRVSVTRRLQHDTARHQRHANIVNLSDSLGAIIVQMMGEARALRHQTNELGYGGETGYFPIGYEWLRLSFASVGSSAVHRFVVPTPGTDDGAETIVITGSPLSGDLAVWAISDVSTARRGTLTPLEPAPTGRGVRVVNLSPGAISMSTPGAGIAAVEPMSASRLDDDLDRLDTLVIDDGSVTPLRYRVTDDRGQSRIFFYSFDTVDQRTRVDERLVPTTAVVAPDSAVLRFYEPRQGYTTHRVIVAATGDSLPVGFNQTNRHLTLAAGMTRILVATVGERDTPFAAISVPLARASASTVVFTIDSDRVRAWLLVDSDPNEQSPLRELRVEPYHEQPEKNPVGRIVLVNAMSAPARLSGEVDGSAFDLVARGAAVLDSMTPGIHSGSLRADRVVVSELPVRADSTTTMIAVDPAGARPHRVLTMYSRMRRDTSESFPRLRIVNALTDIDAVDINAFPAPYQVPERRLFLDEWTEHLPARIGALRIEVQHRAGTVFFSALDSLRANHRYTVVLTGTVAAPVALLIDDDAERQMWVEGMAITRPHVAGTGDDVARTRVVPNPASDQLRIDLDPRDRITHVEIVDALGRSVLRSSVDAPALTLSLDGIAPGLHYVVATGADGIVWRQPIVIH